MTTQAWITKHLDFAMKAKTLEELKLRLQVIVTRLDISPLVEDDDADEHKSAQIGGG